MSEFCHGSRDHRHDWSDWGMFIPEPTDWSPATYLADDVVPEHVAISAKRERFCRNCRGIQQEDHSSGRRIIRHGDGLPKK